MSNMNNDAMLKVAVCLHTNPGAYALLLGAGISIATGIPTGREIESSLIRMIAAVQRSEVTPDEKTWYTNVFHEPAVYDNLMTRLTKSPAERMVLMRRYIEPSPQEAEIGQKQPTKAHRSIATLVKSGYIRIIVTTNFDRLLEQALEAEGVHPFVIASDGDIDTTVPYSSGRDRCYIVKVHGDYQRTDLRNTGQELSQYSPKMQAYLDRLLEDFGLIICGWSGLVDVALRTTLTRVPSKHFTTFWLTRETLGSPAEAAAHDRQAEQVIIDNADNFFVELLEHIESLRELSKGPPLTTAVAVETIKRYLPEPRHRIRLYDLIYAEAKVVYHQLQLRANTTLAVYPQLQAHEKLASILANMLATVGFFGADEHRQLLTDCIELISQAPVDDRMGSLMLYPALLALYVAGISAIAGSRHDLLKAILSDPHYRQGISKEPRSVLDKLLPISESVLVHFPDSMRGRRDAHQFMFVQARNFVASLIPSNTDYKESFDTFERILALTYAHETKDENGLTCLFLFDGVLNSWAASPFGELEKSVTSGSMNVLLKEGFFGGEIQQFNNASIKYQFWLQKVDLLKERP